jgi:S-DNA-T family DNA segregation ATPase FtsK/SpoIIIE
MREILESDFWEADKSGLKLAVGRDVAGKPVVVDLAKMPHLLIAGKTGSGKSVAMNAFLVSLLWNNSPEDLRMILIDPKRVELEPYNNLPHLLTPVITEPEKSVSALAWAVAEMNRRYKDFAASRCRNILEYNEKNPDKKEPYIVIVIDELADLMMVAGKDVEAAICRIAQMARAVGMHLIVATQRPSVDVVTGLIKANLPARIAFRVSSGIDSRVIIDGVGAEDLLGFGDMLYLDGNSGDLSRIQGLYVANEEVERITNHIKLQFPEMIANDEITTQSIEGMAKGGVLTAGLGKAVEDDNLDDLFNDAVSVVMETGKASASFLQRRLEVGYARAARLLDQMESRGIVGPARGAKPREIYGQQD